MVISQAKQYAILAKTSSMKLKKLFELDGTVRCPNTLELLGHWFIVDNVTYWMPYERNSIFNS